MKWIGGYNLLRSREGALIMTTTNRQHRYMEIADILRDQIRSGGLGVGDRLPSFVEMYEQHGATTSTMQKVYDLLEKEELIERRSRSGVYVADVVHQRKCNGMLALALPHFGEQAVLNYVDGSYTMRLLLGVHAEASERGYQITLGTAKQIAASKYPVDGLLFQGDDHLIDECSQLNKPMVSLIVHPSLLSSVGIDDFESGKAITSYLWQQGHRRIAALMGSEYDAVSPQRLRGYQAALTDVGVKLPAEWHRQLQINDRKGYVEWAYVEMSSWLREGWASLNCTALVAQNDSVAVGAIKALRHHGYRVPHDVSVAGFDNAGDDWQFDLKLTSVEIPLEEIGRQAVAVLSERIAQPDAPIKTVKVPTTIVEGESTTSI